MLKTIVILIHNKFVITYLSCHHKVNKKNLFLDGSKTTGCIIKTFYMIPHFQKLFVKTVSWEKEPHRLQSWLETNGTSCIHYTTQNTIFSFL